ncbi:NAD(P)H-binding protein [Streptomyces sp. NPDC057545]|uniref:NAD(P)H-binding protein n=1 Tax=Streptomyces sp. NPDC057545 TaxID=3346164 RepID=UPI00367679EC
MTAASVSQSAAASWSTRRCSSPAPAGHPTARESRVTPGPSCPGTLVCVARVRVVLLTSRLLAERGRRVFGIIRRPEQAAGVRAVGAVPVVADLASATAGQLAQVLAGARAVLFAAGAGLGDAPGQANPVDHDAVLAVADAAQLAGVRRFVLLSAMGADPARHYPADPLVETFLRAKGRADQDLLSRSALDCAVLRPAWFRDGPGTGLVHLAEHTGPGGIERADVAAVLADLAWVPATAVRVLELASGSTPIHEAVGRRLHEPPAHDGHEPTAEHSGRGPGTVAPVPTAWGDTMPTPARDRPRRHVISRRAGERASVGESGRLRETARCCGWRENSTRCRKSLSVLGARTTATSMSPLSNRVNGSAHGNSTRRVSSAGSVAIVRPDDSYTAPWKSIRGGRSRERAPAWASLRPTMTVEPSWLRTPSGRGRTRSPCRAGKAEVSAATPAETDTATFST